MGRLFSIDSNQLITTKATATATADAAASFVLIIFTQMCEIQNSDVSLIAFTFSLVKSFCVCFVFVLCLLCVCFEFVLCLFCVCFVFVLCLFCVCFVFILFLFCVCIVFIFVFVLCLFCFYFVFILLKIHDTCVLDMYRTPINITIFVLQ